MIVSYYVTYANHFDRPGIKATVCKNKNFLLLPVSAQNTIQLKFFCICVFNGGGCLASCLTFRPFSTLDPWQHGCLKKITRN